MMGSFSEMEPRIRAALGLPEHGWVVEPAGAVQGDRCSEVAVYREHGGYSVVSMDALHSDFEGAIGEIRRTWFPSSEERG